MRVVAIWCAVMVIVVGCAAAAQPTGTRSISSEPVYREGGSGTEGGVTGSRAISSEPVYKGNEGAGQNPSTGTKAISSEPVYRSGPDKPKGNDPRNVRVSPNERASSSW